MALGKHYYSEYKSSNGTSYYLEIWEEGFTNNPVEISLGGSGPVIKYDTESEDRFSPILSSSLSLPLMITGSSLYYWIQQLRTTFKERDIYVHLYQATSLTYSNAAPLWSGFLLMDLSASEDKSYPFELNLDFTDGLGLLKDIDFVNLSSAGSSDNTQGSYVTENMYWGPATFIYWFKTIILKSGPALTPTGASQDYRIVSAVNWYNSEMPTPGIGNDPLYNTKCVVSMFHERDPQEVYTPANCYDVLKELLRHWGCR